MTRKAHAQGVSRLAESYAESAAAMRVTASVLIPTWNGKELLRPCIDSLSHQTFRDFEVVVAENGSTDGTRDMLEQEYPWVRVVALDRNYGFARGVHAAYDAATGNLIVLLNNDTETAPTWLEELVAAANKHPEAGYFACKILLAAGSQSPPLCG